MMAGAIWFLLGAVVAYVTAEWGLKDYPAWHALAIGFALVMLAGAGYQTIMWAVYLYGTHRRNMADALETERHALAETPDTRRLELIGKLSGEQLEFIKKNAEAFKWVLEMRHAPLEPRLWLDIGGKQFASEDIAMLIRHSDPPEFCPIRTFSEGSRERELCADVTLRLIQRGYLEDANGNQAARAVGGMDGWRILIESLYGKQEEE